jgi:hypothetical protein
MSRPGIKPMASTVGGEHSRKEPFEQLVNSYFGTSTYDRATSGECLRHGSPSELHYDVGRIALARHQQSICQLPRHQALASPSIHCQAGQITLGSPLDLGVLLPKQEVPRLTCLGRESSLASTVGGKHFRKEPFEQLVNCLWNIHK